LSEINELSKNLLSKYMKKAVWDKKDRSEGMEKAAKKLHKEEFELNELSTAVLTRYMDKAPSRMKTKVKDMKSAVARVGLDNTIGDLVKATFGQKKPMPPANPPAKKPKYKMVDGKMTQVNELDKKTLEDFITKSLEKRVGMYIDGKVAGHMMKTHMKSVNLAQDKIDKQHKKELGKIFSDKNEKPEDKKDVKKESTSLVDRLHRQLSEEFPTNAMGNSSSTSGTGPIDTFDPLLIKKKAKRKVKVAE
jgi:hypothetical protein